MFNFRIAKTNLNSISQLKTKQIVKIHNFRQVNFKQKNLDKNQIFCFKLGKMKTNYNSKNLALKLIHLKRFEIFSVKSLNVSSK